MSLLELELKNFVLSFFAGVKRVGVGGSDGTWWSSSLSVAAQVLRMLSSSSLSISFSLSSVCGWTGIGADPFTLSGESLWFGLVWAPYLPAFVLDLLLRQIVLQNFKNQYQGHAQESSGAQRLLLRDRIEGDSNSNSDSVLSSHQ